VRRTAWTLAVLGLGFLLSRLDLSGRAAPPAGGPVSATTQPADKANPVHEDWLVQARVRQGKGAGIGAVSTAEDAAGGCDGIKDGKWGFHTSAENDGAWWQVDLGKVYPLTRVVVYNRCETPRRTAAMELLLSGDGKTWTKAYRHNGKSFYGFTDGKPLTIALDGAQARYVRLKNTPGEFFNLDEVEVYGRDDTNLALHRPADQSSVSQWSVCHDKGSPLDASYPLETVIRRGRELAADLRTAGVGVQPCLKTLDEVEIAAKSLPAGASGEASKPLYFRARAAVRKLAFANPLLDFDGILFVKRVPSSYSHMSDQYYSWWSRPGEGCSCWTASRATPRASGA
jgi:hypothetical protein